MMVHLPTLTLVSVTQMLQTGEMTAHELMEATLNRIEEVNPTYNAIVALRPRDELLAEARRLDDERSTSIITTQRLWGIPMAIKDMSNAKGLPTTKGGSPLSRDCVTTESDPFVQRLQNNGAIIIGKSNAPEWGLGSHTFNRRWGTTCNAHDESKSAGGSSGGAAVAVAKGMLLVADGSDMMGSLRNPAGWNGIYSLRPTAGRMEHVPSSLLPYPISTEGPMGRNLDDLKLLAECMIPDFCASKDRWEDMVKDERKTVRTGWLGDWGGHLACEEGILATCYTTLHKCDIDLRVLDPPFTGDELWKSWTTIRAVGIAGGVALEHDVEDVLASDVCDELKREIEKGLEVTSTELKEAQAIARDWSRCVDELFDDFDALALPSAQLWPFPKEWKNPQRIGDRDMDAYHRWMEVVVPATLAGLPVLTIPGGTNHDGLCIGIQLIGKRNEDDKLLELARYICRQ